eukprot:gene8913-9650_t
MLKSVTTKFTDCAQPNAGHYVNIHTKKQLKKKRKLDETTKSSSSSTVVTYNLLYIPRILKSDLRRQYPVMFMNAFNSCDYHYMRGFVDKFLRDDCRFIVEAPTRHLPMKAISYGKENCAKAWYDRMEDAPDLRFQLTSSQMKLRSDGSCTCVATFSYSGTAIIYVDPKKIQTILKYCQVNECGILTLPNPFTFASSISSNHKESSSSSSSFSSSSSIFPHTSFDTSCLNHHLVQREIDEENRWNEVLLNLHDNNQYLKTMNKLFLDHLDHSYSIPNEENEYLYSVFDNSLNLTRSSKKTLIPNTLLRLGFPFEFVGDLIFQLDEESRIITNEMKAYLATRTPNELLHC